MLCIISQCDKIASEINTQLAVIGALFALFFGVTFIICIVVVVLGVKGHLQRKELQRIKPDTLESY